MTAIRLLAAFLLCLIASAGLGAEPDADPAKMLARLSKDRVDAARRTFDTMWKNYREGRRVSDDSLYRWSLRLLDSEKEVATAPADKIAAYEGHRKRMRELESLISNLQRAGQTTVDEVSSTEYYRIEADIWLLKAKSEKKE